VTYDELLAAVKAEGGFDVPDAMVGGWINEVHQKAVAESQWMMRTLELGPTIAGTATYVLPDAVVDLVGLFVAPPAQPPATYGRVSTEQLWGLKSGSSWLADGAVFAPQFDASAVELVELYPPPGTSGASISALAAMIPGLMVSGDSPVIPADMHGDLKDGAIALGLLRVDERADSSQLFDQRFQAMVAKLRRRKKSRVGSQTSRMLVWGADWR
jgi:hypothetical protein